MNKKYQIKVLMKSLNVFNLFLSYRAKNVNETNAKKHKWKKKTSLSSFKQLIVQLFVHKNLS